LHTAENDVKKIKTAADNVLNAINEYISHLEEAGNLITKRIQEEKMKEAKKSSSAS
jgi:hypothetical protein